MRRALCVPCLWCAEFGPAELEGEDYSLSILIGVMAVESYLARRFLKLKGMDSYATAFKLPMTALGEGVSKKRWLRSPDWLLVEKTYGNDLRQVR